MKMLRFYRSVKYTRPKQLLARLELMVRRKRNVRRADELRQTMLTAKLPDLNLAEPLPKAVLPMRTFKLEETKNGYAVTLLNETRQLSHPVDWHAEELKYGTRLWLLNLHYMEFVEGASDEGFTNLIEDWIDNNPPYSPGYWLDDWNSFSLSIRVLVWMQQYELRLANLPEAFKEKLLASLVRQLRFLYDNLELDLGGNHLLKNIKALLWAGRFFGFEEAKKWTAKGERLLEQELAEQMLSDGMHYERSPAYHAQVFADLLECYVVLKEGELKSKLASHLARAAQVLADTMHPDGYTSLYNDGGLKMAYLPDECLRAYEAVTGQVTKPRAVFALEAAGYYGARDNSDYVLVDCGDIAPDFLPAHGHGDILSFEWTLSGQRMIVDAGVYEYNPGERRDYSRTTKAHNTVTLDGDDQCDFWGAFRVARRAHPKLVSYSASNEGFDLIGEHDGYKHLLGSPVHQRQFEVTPTKLVIKDKLKGGQGQLAEARLLLHPACRLELTEDGATICREGVKVVLTTDASLQVKDAYWHPDFGVEETCQQLVLNYGHAPCEGSFVLEKVTP